MPFNAQEVQAACSAVYAAMPPTPLAFMPKRHVLVCYTAIPRLESAEYTH